MCSPDNASSNPNGVLRVGLADGLSTADASSFGCSLAVDSGFDGPGKPPKSLEVQTNRFRMSGVIIAACAVAMKDYLLIDQFWTTGEIVSCCERNEKMSSPIRSFVLCFKIS
jgi:hypothetical protein